MRSFQSFINPKEPVKLDGRDLQDFLSYLAVVLGVQSPLDK